MKNPNSTQIKIGSQYKNIPTQEIYLPSFTILVGVNGSGKSNFLELLKSISEETLNKFKIPNLIHILEKEKTRSVIKINGKPVTQARFFNVFESVSNKNIPMGAEIEGLDEGVLVAFNFIKKHAHIGYQSWSLYEDYHEYYIQIVLRTILLLLNKTDANQLSPGDLLSLSWDQIAKIYPNTMIKGDSNDTNFFSANISSIFIAYHNLEQTNKYNQYLNLKGSSVEYKTDEEFITTYGPRPWEFLNKVLKSADLPYEISYPTSNEKITNFKAELIKKDVSKTLNFSDLSSGEKTLLIISLSIFNAKKGNNQPELLLLDEADATLHPEMSAKLFNVIKEVFVEDYKMQVILTTHSPTTVAMANEYSIYMIQKSTGEVLKVSKDSALKDLLIGIPFLGISYENRKQIFVESDYDVHFYESLDNNPNIQRNKSYLHFLSSGRRINEEDTGSCDRVRKIVNQLNENGNKQVYGLVDYDLKNQSNENIFVLGEELRYARENYTYDPLYLGLFMIKNNLLTQNNDKEIFNLRYRDIGNAPEEVLQKIYSHIYNKLDLPKSNQRTCYLYNKYKINCYESALQIKAHDLEHIVYKKIPALNKYKLRNGHFTQSYEHHLYSGIIKDFPEFIYLELFELIQKLHDIPFNKE